MNVLLNELERESNLTLTENGSPTLRSIPYHQLPSFFMGFSMWNEKNVCLSWDETTEWFSLIGIEPVPVLHRGIFDEKTIRGLWRDSDWETREGYVVRPAGSFAFRDFKNVVGKFVRAGHIQTVKHGWRNRNDWPTNTMAEQIGK